MYRSERKKFPVYFSYTASVCAKVENDRLFHFHQFSLHGKGARERWGYPDQLIAKATEDSLDCLFGRNQHIGPQGFCPIMASRVPRNSLRRCYSLLAAASKNGVITLCGGIPSALARVLKSG